MCPIGITEVFSGRLPCTPPPSRMFLCDSSHQWQCQVMNVGQSDPVIVTAVYFRAGLGRKQNTISLPFRTLGQHAGCAECGVLPVCGCFVSAIASSRGGRIRNRKQRKRKMGKYHQGDFVCYSHLWLMDTVLVYSQSIFL